MCGIADIWYVDHPSSRLGYQMANNEGRRKVRLPFWWKGRFIVNEPIQVTGFDQYGHAQFDYSRDKTTYQAQAGDSLLSIANQYKIGLQQLRFYNNIDKHTFAVRTGQTIHIPSAQVLIPLGR